MLSSCFAAQLSPASLLSSLFSAASLRSMSTVQLSSSHAVDLLVLGAGWTGTFLLPHLRADHPDISFATTTRDGRDGSIRWQFDPELEGPEQFAGLPRAKTAVVVFPIKGEGGSRRLVRGYEEAVGARARWIQLGSTGIFDVRSVRVTVPSGPANLSGKFVGRRDSGGFARSGCAVERRGEAGPSFFSTTIRVDNSSFAIRQDERASGCRR